MLGAKAKADVWTSTDVTPADAQAHHRDTPPRETLWMSRQVSWLTGHRQRPVFPRRSTSVTFNGLWLAAYSCGGSSGFGFRRTGFPLSSRQTNPENHDSAATMK